MSQAKKKNVFELLFARKVDEPEIKYKTQPSGWVLYFSQLKGTDH